jgi:hypothetical protein
MLVMRQCLDAYALALAFALFGQHRISEIVMSLTGLVHSFHGGGVEAAVAFGCRPMISALTDAEKDLAGSQTPEAL